MTRITLDGDFVATYSAKYEAGLVAPWNHGILRDERSEPEVEGAIATCQTAWDFENYLFTTVHENVHAAGHFTRGALLLVGYWKSPRVVKCLAMNQDVVSRTAVALGGPKPWEALRGLHGVGVPVASAMLAVWKPDTYTVIDFRALETLALAEDVESDFAKSQAWWEGHYARYLKECARLRPPSRSLRDFDRALWRYSKDH